MSWFDLLSRYYDRVLRYGGPQDILPLLQLEPQHRLLDVGGGTGRVAATLAGAAQVVVCDPSTGMLAEARTKGLRAAAGPAEVLPFPDGSFDRILIVDAFHHLGDQRASAAEMVRVLASGGRL